jgi:hypothetical protein
MQTETKTVRLKGSDASEIINASDFNPSIHTEVTDPTAAPVTAPAAEPEKKAEPKAEKKDEPARRAPTPISAKSVQKNKHVVAKHAGRRSA